MASTLQLPVPLNSLTTSCRSLLGHALFQASVEAFWREMNRSPPFWVIENSGAESRFPLLSTATREVRVGLFWQNTFVGISAPCVDTNRYIHIWES